MASFLLSVFASIIAGIMLLASTAILSSRARSVLIGVLGRLLDVDIDGVFQDKRAAEVDVRKELGRAREICIFAGRGHELQRDTFDPIFLHRPATKTIRVRVLLPQTEGAMDHDWTQQRQTELAQFDRAFLKPRLLKDQIETTVRFLDQYVKSGQAELRRFCYPHIGRIIITDRCLYFTPYRHDSHGRNCPIYKFRRGELYDNFSRLFDQLWNVGGLQKPT